jgi:hypothetical protein
LLLADAHTLAPIMPHAAGGTKPVRDEARRLSPANFGIGAARACG